MTRPTQGTLQRQQAFAYGSVTLYGRPFQIVLLADCLITPVEGPTTPKWKPLRFGLFPVRSPLLRKSIFLSFPADTEMFQFSAFATRVLCIQTRSVQESRDHHLFDGSPGLIAVFRALQSLLMPRHPPCALSSLTTRIECSRMTQAKLPWPVIHGTDLEFHLPNLESSPASAPAPSEVVTFLAASPHLLSRSSRLMRHAFALGERRSQSTQRRLLTAFFQDANYHDQIVKEQNKPAAILTTPHEWERRRCNRLVTCSGSRCHGQRFDAEGPHKTTTHRTGPQPMTSVSNEQHQPTGSL